MTNLIQKECRKNKILLIIYMSCETKKVCQWMAIYTLPSRGLSTLTKESTAATIPDLTKVTYMAEQ